MCPATWAYSPTLPSICTSYAKYTPIINKFLGGGKLADGYVLFHRCLLDKPIWCQSTPAQKIILVTLLLMANHKEKEWLWKGIKYKVQPGQFITSIESIARRAGVSNQNVRTALVKFESLDFLTNQSTMTGRLITIVNWHLYQVEMRGANKDTNKGVTKRSQSTNKELTPNKNDKNDKNDKKINYSELVRLTSAEYERLVTEFGQQGVARLIEILDNYKGANGKKYADDNRAIRNWVIKRYEEELQNPKKLSKREQDDIERRRLAEEYDRLTGQQTDRSMQSKLPSVFKF